MVVVLVGVAVVVAVAVLVVVVVVVVVLVVIVVLGGWRDEHQAERRHQDLHEGLDHREEGPPEDEGGSAQGLG